MPLEKKNDDDDAYLSCDNADDFTFVPPVIFPEKLSDGRWVSGDFDLDEELDRDYITGMLEYKAAGWLKLTGGFTWTPNLTISSHIVTRMILCKNQCSEESQ